MVNIMEHHAIQITLRGRQNITYTGTLVLSPANGSGLPYFGGDLDAGRAGNGTDKDDYDQKGASYYVVAVVLVYGMSIVALIASHIKRRHAKVLEDKQIDKYLQDFQIVRDKHDRDNYRKLKRAVMTKINWDRGRRGTVHNLHNIIPLLAVGIHHGASGSASLRRASLAAKNAAMYGGDPRDRHRVYPQCRSLDEDRDLGQTSPHASLGGSLRDLSKLYSDGPPQRRLRRQSSIHSIREEEECEQNSPTTPTGKLTGRPRSPGSQNMEALTIQYGGLVKTHKPPQIYLTIEPPSEEDLQALAEAPDSGVQHDSLEPDVVWLGRDEATPSPISPDSGCGTPHVLLADSPLCTPSPALHRAPHAPSPRRSRSPASLALKNGYGSSLHVHRGRKTASPSSQHGDSEGSDSLEDSCSADTLLTITCV